MPTTTSGGDLWVQIGVQLSVLNYPYPYLPSVYDPESTVQSIDGQQYVISIYAGRGGEVPAPQGSPYIEWWPGAYTDPYSGIVVGGRGETTASFIGFGGDLNTLNTVTPNNFGGQTLPNAIFWGGVYNDFLLTSIQNVVATPEGVLQTTIAPAGSTFASAPLIVAAETYPFNTGPTPHDTTIYNFTIAYPAYVWVDLGSVSTLFTTGADTVDFNNLTAAQQATIASGADFYHGLGGNDIVTLPSTTNYNESLGNAGGTLNWDPTQTFYTMSQAGDTYRVYGSDGNYNIALGAGSDSVTINGNGNSNITAGTGSDTINLNGTGTNKITIGSGTVTLADWSGTLNTQNGNTISATGFDLGFQSGAVSNATLDDAALVSAGPLTVGDSSSGVLTVQNGTTISATDFDIGYRAGSFGNASVDSSSLTISGPVTVGDGGSGTLTFQDNTTLSASSLDVAYQSGSSGSGSLDNSSINISGPTTVGDAGSGALNLTNGATLTTAGLIVGNQSGGSGELTLDDSTISDSLYFTVASAGNGSAELKDDSEISAGSVGVGHEAGGKGQLTVDSSNLTISGSFTIGVSGSGAVELQDGSEVQAASLDVGYQAGSDGDLTLDGSSFNVSGAATVGDGGSGTLSLTDGASFSAAATLAFGWQESGSAHVTLDDSTMLVSGGMGVAGSGSGTLTAQNGSTITEEASFGIGVQSGGDGTVTIDDSQLNVSKALQVGSQGSGTLIEKNGSTISALNLFVGFSSGGDGSVTVDHSEIDATTGSIIAGDSGTGTLTAQDESTLNAKFLDIGQLTGSAGSEIVLDNSTANITSSVNIGLGDTATLVLQDGATLDTPVVNIASHGTLELGDTETASMPEGLTFNGNLNLQSGGTLDLGNNDLTISGSATLDGTVTGSGTLIVTGPLAATDNFSVEGDATVDLSESTSSASFSGAISLGDDDTLTVMDATASGTGSVTFVGDALQLTAFDDAASSDTLATSLSGSGAVTVSSGATLVLASSPYFTGYAKIEDSGTLELTSADAIGSGSISFDPNGTNETLRVDGAVMPDNAINSFQSGDTIDLRSIPFDPLGLATLLADNALAIAENGQSYELSLDGIATKGESFQLSADGAGGTNIQLQPGEAGFDIGNFPGVAVMEQLYTNTNLSWTGFYLDAPNHTRSGFPSPWVGNAQELMSEGWKLAPIYVGQQNTSGTSVTVLNAGTLATQDSNQAISELATNYIPKGSVVYLDIESGATLSIGELGYVEDWCSAINSAGYFAGVYCTATQEATIVSVVPGTPLWIVHTDVLPTVPNGGVVLPTPDVSLSGPGTGVQAWQYLINNYSFSPNVNLAQADLDSFVQTGTTTSVAAATSADNTIINNGETEDVFGTDFNATINDGGFQYVMNGGVATAAVANDPGIQIINRGGLAINTTLNGGIQGVYGKAIGTVIESGGLENVFAGGVTQGTIINGGTLELAAGGIVGDGSITFLGKGGVLQVDDFASTQNGVQQTDFRGPIAGFSTADTIILEGFGNVSSIDGGSPTFDATTGLTTLTLTDDGSIVGTMILVGNYSAEKFVFAVNSEISGAIDVSIAPITATPASISGTEYAALNAVVATFTDGNPNATASEFTATVNWGDGTTSTGTVVAQNGGGFAVDGTHTYTGQGSYHPVVTINDVGGSTASVTDTAAIADAPITASPTSISGTEYAALNAVVATFTDGNPNATAGEFTATVNWGDGTTTTGRVVTLNGGGFAVDGTHTYSEQGSYHPVVTINDFGGSTASVTDTAAIADANVLSGQGLNISATADQALSNVAVAKFSDTYLSANANNFTATIDWGDGTTSGGTVAGGDGAFTVTGTHTYTATGKDNVTVTLSEVPPGNATATADSSVKVAAPQSQPPIITSDGGGNTASVIITDDTKFVDQVQATDADANSSITYSIIGGENQKLFTINPQNGDLSFKSQPTSGGTYQVEVGASERGLEATQTINIKVADGTFEFGKPGISNTFVFHSDFGLDVIENFENFNPASSNHDVIEFNHSLFQGAKAGESGSAALNLIDNHSIQVGHDLFILTNGGVVDLANTNQHSLTSHDFLIT